MANVLIPTDFSDNALNAAIYAVRLFGTNGNHFTVLNCFSMPHGRAGGFRNFDDMLAEDSAEGLVAFMEKLRSKLPEPVPAFETASEQGLLVDVIKRFEADPVPPDVIVQGTQGASGLKRILIGSNTAAVIMNSRTPVLAVPEEATYSAPRGIMLFEGGGRVEPTTLGLLVDLARANGSEVGIVHVKGPDNDDERTSATNLDEILGDIPHTRQTVAGANVMMTLNELVDTNKADLVVAVHRRRGLFESLFKRSMTTRLVMNTRTPVLILHQP
jgi:nucleotide-binding universal stress UspA family protein